MNEPSASQLGISKRRCFLTGADLVGLVGRPNGVKSSCSHGAALLSRNFSCSLT